MKHLIICLTQNASQFSFGSCVAFLMLARGEGTRFHAPSKACRTATNRVRLTSELSLWRPGSLNRCQQCSQSSDCPQRWARLAAPSETQCQRQWAPHEGVSAPSSTCQTHSSAISAGVGLLSRCMLSSTYRIASCAVKCMSLHVCIIWGAMITQVVT